MTIQCECQPACPMTLTVEQVGVVWDPILGKSNGRIRINIGGSHAPCVILGKTAAQQLMQYIIDRLQELK